IIDGRLALLTVWVVAPIRVEPAAEPVVVVVLLLALLRATAPVPKLLRLRRQQQRKADARHHDCKCSGLEGWAHDLSPMINYGCNSNAPAAAWPGALSRPNQLRMRQKMS